MSLGGYLRSVATGSIQILDGSRNMVSGVFGTVGCIASVIGSTFTIAGNGLITVADIIKRDDTSKCISQDINDKYDLDIDDKHDSVIDDDYVFCDTDDESV